MQDNPRLEVLKAYERLISWTYPRIDEMRLAEVAYESKPFFLVVNSGQEKGVTVALNRRATPLLSQKNVILGSLSLYIPLRWKLNEVVTLSRTPAPCSKCQQRYAICTPPYQRALGMWLPRWLRAAQPLLTQDRYLQDKNPYAFPLLDGDAYLLPDELVEHWENTLSTTLAVNVSLQEAVEERSKFLEDFVDIAKLICGTCLVRELRTLSLDLKLQQQIWERLKDTDDHAECEWQIQYFDEDLKEAHVQPRFEFDVDYDNCIGRWPFRGFKLREVMSKRQDKRLVVVAAVIAVQFMALTLFFSAIEAGRLWTFYV